MTTVTDDLVLWNRRLRGEDVMIDVETPHAGFYKMRSGRDGPYLPVAIWRKEGELVCRVGTTMRDPIEVWTYCAKNPVTREDAKFAFENGRWPDMPEEAPRSNLPDDPFEALKMELEDKLAQAEALMAKGDAARTEKECNLARNIQAKILDLKNKADDLHAVEKNPVLEKGREIDDKYRFRATAKTVADRLRDFFGAWLKAEEAKKRAEAQAKFEAERKAAEEVRAKVEAERKKLLAEDPIAALTSPEPELPEVPRAPEPVKVQAGGGFGRRAGLKTEYVGDIVDYDLALLHFKAHPDVKAVIEKLVKAAVKASKGTSEIPGVKIREDRKVA